MTADVAPWLKDSRWPTVPIRFVARVGTGHTPSRQHPEYWDNCTVPWVTLADVGQLRDGTVDTILSTVEKISPLGIANSSAVKHPAGTVILSRTASVGFSAILGTDMATSQDFATWTCGEKLDPRYLLHALRAMAPDLRRLVMGSTHMTVYMPDIAALRVPVPPVTEQRRIADFLDVETRRIERIVGAREAQARLLGDRRDCLIDEVMNATAGAEYKLFHALTVLRDGTHQPPPRVDAGIPILTARNVSSGKLRFTPMDTHVSARDAADLENSLRMSAGDILLSVKGTVGAVAIVPPGFPRSVLDRNLALLRVRPNLISPGWLANSLRTGLVQEQMRLAMSFAAQPGLALGSIRDIRIRIPDMATQRSSLEELTSNLSILENLALTIDAQRALLAMLRQALITAAVTGQFDVTTGRGADLS